MPDDVLALTLADEARQLHDDYLKNYKLSIPQLLDGVQTLAQKLEAHALTQALTITPERREQIGLPLLKHIVKRLGYLRHQPVSIETLERVNNTIRAATCYEGVSFQKPVWAEPPIVARIDEDEYGPYFVFEVNPDCECFKVAP